jgi:hypothetical protein
MSNPMGGCQPPSTTMSDPAPTPSTTDYATTDSSTTDVAKGEAASVGGSAKEATGQVASTAAEQAKNVAGETKQQAKNLLDQAGGQVTEQADAGKQKAVGGLRSLADELRSMAEGNGAQSGMTGDLARQAADKAHEFASWLDQRDPGSLLDEIRGLARRKPGTFLLGAAIAGVAAGRLTRGVVAAKSEEQSTTGYAGNGSASTYGTTAPTYAATGTTFGQTDQTAFTGQDATGIRNPDTGPLVVDPDPTSESLSTTGLGMEEDRR